MAKRKPVKKLTASLASKVLEVVDAGLSSGLGSASPGSMCVEAAVCYAYGEPHTDQPRCVLPEIRNFKISMNDSEIWYNLAANDAESKHVLDVEQLAKKYRADGLRRLAIVQLGSKEKISSEAWRAALRELWKKHNPNEVKEYEAGRKRLITNLTEALAAAKNAKTGEGIYIGGCFESVPSWSTEIDGEEWLHGAKSLKEAKRRCEAIVQLLIKLKSPGTKYLYLTEKAKPKKGAKPVKKVKAKKAK